MTLDSANGVDEFMSGIDGMDAFINEEVPSQEGGCLEGTIPGITRLS